MVCFFFFKQKTAYEMLRSLVGSEMCIRDRRQEVLLERYKFRCKCPKCAPAVDSQRNFSMRFIVGTMLVAMVMFVWMQYIYSVFEVEDGVTAQRRREFEEQTQKDVMKTGGGSAFKQSSGTLADSFPDIHANDPYSKLKW
eukprot:TRINITY_DN23535_c0_g1_i3.p1 TRINITY_DN23535_c0_g1~~TRINITY_DN23535_c0_g1_i3.p1  ORF type:complete len:140 (+),score=44.29 TRINITY_DN23535_c0_g1_i3:56-475(+)